MSANNYILGNGCENTFLIFDCLKQDPVYKEDFYQNALASLRKEKRDDALILLTRQIKDKHLKLEMQVLEPDGSIAAFCGNGARVVAAYLMEKYPSEFKQFSLMTHQGEHKLFRYSERQYGVEMLNTKFNPNCSMFVSPTSELFKQQNLYYNWKFQDLNFSISLFFTETTEPHLVTFDALSEQELFDAGQYINQNYRLDFPKGINLNHVDLINRDTIYVKTYERGVNRMTQACGTGATSCAVLSRAQKKVDLVDLVNVRLPGGELIIQFQADKSSTSMIGPAVLENLEIQIPSFNPIGV